MSDPKIKFDQETKLYNETIRLLDELEDEAATIERSLERIYQLSLNMESLAKSNQENENSSVLIFISRFWFRFSGMATKLLRTFNFRKAKLRLDTTKLMLQPRKQTPVKTTTDRDTKGLYVAQLYHMNLDE